MIGIYLRAKALREAKALKARRVFRATKVIRGFKAVREIKACKAPKAFKAHKEPKVLKATKAIRDLRELHLAYFCIKQIQEPLADTLVMVMSFGITPPKLAQPQSTSAT